MSRQTLRRRFLDVEQCELRYCLAGFGFAAHGIDTSEVVYLDSLSTADLDGDLDQDILLAGQDRVAWYENTDGQGTFGRQQVVGTQTDQPNSVAAGDLDSDGDLDLVVASVEDESIHWYPNVDGKGRFGAHRVVGNSSIRSIELLVIDIDGDNDDDIVSITSSETNNRLLEWYENTDGNGEFGESRIIAEGVWRATSGDFDGDGDLDLVSTSLTHGSIYWHENTSTDDTLWPQHPVHSILRHQGGRAVAAADMDGDGDLDVAATYFSSGVVWYENTNGLGGFEAEYFFPNDAALNFIDLRGIIAADIDSDGDTDILTDGYLHENQDGTGKALQEKLAAVSLDLVAIADLDGDGDLDLVMPTGSIPSFDERLTWREFENGVFTEAQTLGKNIGFTAGIQLADIDRDGDLDAIATPLFPASDRLDLYGNIYWYENINGDFTRKHVVGATGAPLEYLDDFTSLFPVDLDSDADIDIMTRSGRWYENVNGSGDFVLRTRIDEAVQLVDVFDVDGDSDPDVISWRGETVWYENTDGVFSEPQLLNDEENLGFLDSITPSDIDNDGDLDLIARYSRGQVVWLENRENQYQSHHILLQRSASTIRSAEMDGDGVPEVLISQNGRIVFYKIVDGEVLFTRDIHVDHSSFDVVDIDDDGDLDLIVSSHDSDLNTLSWYENDDGDFSNNYKIWNRQNIWIAFDSAHVAVGDIDLDGDLDIAATSIFQIYWFENRQIGDANADGVFSSKDLVKIFQADEFEDGIRGNSTFEEGDWNSDGDFDSQDLVLAFQSGSYLNQLTKKSTVSLPTAASQHSMLFDLSDGYWNRHSDWTTNSAKNKI